MKKNAIVIIGHGAPPLDFPRKELNEYFVLNSKKERKNFSKEDEKKLKKIEKKIRNWKRTKRNDPYWEGLHELSDIMEKESGFKVFTGFDEFCSPDVVECISNAVKCGYKKIFVLSSMLIKGGSHSEKNILKKVKTAKSLFPHIDIHYAWPIPIKKIARFFIENVLNSP